MRTVYAAIRELLDGLDHLFHLALALGIAVGLGVFLHRVCRVRSVGVLIIFGVAVWIGTMVLFDLARDPP